MEEGRRPAPQTEQRQSVQEQQSLQEQRQSVKEQQSVQEPPAGLPMSIVLAAFFHDIVYDPRRGDNEEVSAALAAGLLRSVGVGEEVRPVVYKP